MSGSTTNLDLISSSQASKEVTANALFDAESPAALYGRRASMTANLTWGYYGGALSVNGVVTAIANGTKTLTNAATNYLEADPTTGNVAVNTSNFTTANIPLYSIVTSGNMVTSYVDYRTGPGFFADRSGSSSQVFSVAPATAAAHAVRLDQITASSVRYSSANVSGSATINTQTDITSTNIELAPGTYDIDFGAALYMAGAVGVGVVGTLGILLLTKADNTEVARCVSGFANNDVPITIDNARGYIQLVVSATTTYKLRFMYIANSGSPTLTTLTAYCIHSPAYIAARIRP